MSLEESAHRELLEVFRDEAETHTHVLTSALLSLERMPSSADQLEACMRAAHSLKGAARMMGIEAGVRVAHAMEDCFVATQHDRIALGAEHIDALIEATDILARLARNAADGTDAAHAGHREDIDGCLRRLAALREAPAALAPTPPAPALERRRDDEATDAGDRPLRVTADSLNQLIGLAGESLVESRWIKPFTQSLAAMKRQHKDVIRVLDRFRDSLAERAPDDELYALVSEAQRQVLAGERELSQRLAELELFDHRATRLSRRLYHDSLACRMRPFADAIQACPRIVRDTAKMLGKAVRLEISGESTQVDREILRKLDAPLGHLLRNAVDHGLEDPERRRAAGKPVEGVVRIEARHWAGALHVTVSDDGCGVDLEALRAKVVERQLVKQAQADALSDAELFEFLFLPGFSTKVDVTALSGRGVGLDAVQEMVRQVHGTVRVSSTLGQGTAFRLEVPVTLSVARTLLAEIGGEPYAFPLTCIVRMVSIAPDTIEWLEGRPHFTFEGRQVGLMPAHEVLETAPSPPTAGDRSVIVVGDATRTYGLLVDRFLGERELVVQPLDAALGKIRDIAAGAVMPDGSPVLIIDPDDLIRSIDRRVSEDRVVRQTEPAPQGASTRRRVLVVDDSLTVREVERKLLAAAGYDVEVAVDGMDGWNAVRGGTFDLVITDIDMPRMDGIELVTRIGQDARLKSVPVVVVSYKDREEDRQRGLAAGAARYLTKGSFHDDTLVQAVVALIGEATA